MQITKTDKIVKVVQEEQIVLTMSKDEAIMLSRIVGQIGIAGYENRVLRDFIGSVYSGLAEKGCTCHTRMPRGCTISTE